MRKTASKLIAAAGTSAVTAVALTNVVLAKTYEYSSSDDGSALGGLVVLCLYCFGFLIGIAMYIFIALQIAKIYEKNGIKDKKIMAFIPFAQTYYLAIAIGEEKDALLYTLAPLFSAIPCVGWVATLYFAIKLILKVGKRMGREDSTVILLAVVGLFIPFVYLYLYYYLAEGTPVTTASAPAKTEEAKK